MLYRKNGSAAVFFRVPLIFLLLVGSLRAQHTVLVEGCSSSTCPHCAVAAKEIYAIYESGEHDFLYVALVANKNSYAWKRTQELGVSGVPDYIFDGDFDRWLGSGGLPDAYTSRLRKSAERAVADIDLDVSPTWEAAGLLRVEVGIENKGKNGYAGRLRVYVAEIVSRWRTTSGDPFHFAVIGDYAVNQDIAISSGERKVFSGLWDGLAYGFEDIRKDNVAVVAAVYDGSSGYVDDSVMAVFAVETEFVRGNVNADGKIDIADAVFVLGYLFGGAGEPPCLDAADANDDGSVNVADAIAVLSHLFGGAGPLPGPFGECGPDVTEDELDCASFPPCESR